MLNNGREAWQRKHREITFSDFHHCVPALFSVCACARGGIRGLTYMRMYFDTPSRCDVFVKAEKRAPGHTCPSWGKRGMKSLI